MMKRCIIVYLWLFCLFARLLRLYIYICLFTCMCVFILLACLYQLLIYLFTSLFLYVFMTGGLMESGCTLF
jgi:hypothetical protein